MATLLDRERNPFGPEVLAKLDTPGLVLARPQVP